MGTISANDARFSTTTMSGTPCGDVPHCLYMWVNPLGAYETYSMKYEANLSIPMSRYSNATQLSFNWSYKIRWGCSALPGGYNLTSISRVGSTGANTYSTSFPPTDWSTLKESNDWPTTISHSGTTLIERYGDSPLGFVYISIDLTMPHPLNSSVSYYIKGATFDLATPTSSALASITTSSNSTLSSGNRTSTFTSSTISTSTRLSSIVGGPEWDPSPQSSIPAAVGSPGSQPSLSNSPPSMNGLIPAISGAMVGVFALLGLVGLFLFLLQRRARNERMHISHEEAAPTTTQQSDSLIFTPMVMRLPSALRNIDTSKYLSTEEDSVPKEESDHVFLPSVSQTDDPPRGRVADEVVDIHPESTISWTTSTFSENADYQQEDEEQGETVGSREAPPPYHGPVGIHTASGSSRNANQPLPPISVQALETFARMHRAEISEELEAKLEMAGYVPSDDPDVISEEVWARDYAVDGRELVLLRQLYQRCVLLQ